MILSSFLLLYLLALSTLRWILSGNFELHPLPGWTVLMHPDFFRHYLRCLKLPGHALLLGSRLLRTILRLVYGQLIEGGLWRLSCRYYSNSSWWHCGLIYMLIRTCYVIIVISYQRNIVGKLIDSHGPPRQMILEALTLGATAPHWSKSLPVLQVIYKFLVLHLLHVLVLHYHVWWVVVSGASAQTNTLARKWRWPVILLVLLEWVGIEGWHRHRVRMMWWIHQMLVVHVFHYCTSSVG